MTTHDESMNDEWNGEAGARLKSLPAERAPSREMKRRTLEAARAAGYVRAKPSRTVARSVARSVALLAAAALIFFAGTLLGYALPRRATPAAGKAESANHEAVALAPGFTINSEPKRHIVWY
jgi:hypothetical protein